MQRFFYAYIYCMRAITIFLVLTSGLVRSQDVNKFAFSSGMEFNMWNVSIFNKSDSIYFNYSLDDNYWIYQEARRVVESNGFDFSTPTEYTEYNDGNITITNVIYETVPFGSDSNYTMLYENDVIKILVHFSEKGSDIFIYKK